MRRIHRPAEVITLALGAKLRTQVGELPMRLDTLCHDPQFEAFAHGDDGIHQQGFLRIILDILYERLVDLERIDRKTLQVTEAGITGAKVVDGNLHTEFPERMQYRHRVTGVLHQTAFCQFQFQLVRVQAGLAQDGTHFRHESLVAKLNSRNIDCDQAHIEAVFQPLRRLLTGFAQRPSADRHDQAAVFGDAHELPRVDQRLIGGLDPQESLGTGDGARLETHFRLVMQHEFVFVQRFA